MGVPGRIVRPVDAALAERIDGDLGALRGAGAGAPGGPVSAGDASHAMTSRAPFRLMPLRVLPHRSHLSTSYIGYICDVGSAIARSYAAFSWYCARSVAVLLWPSVFGWRSTFDGAGGRADVVER